MLKQEERLFKNRYYYGKLLTEEGFRLEQQWVQQHQRLHGRWALGAGVLEGLAVERAYDDCVAVSPGVAVDGLGRLLILGTPVTCILREMEGFDAQASVLLIALHYEETPVHPRFCAPGAQEGTTEYDCTEERASVILCAEASAELVILGSVEMGTAGSAARVLCRPQKPEPPAAKRMTSDMLREFAEHQMTAEEIRRLFQSEAAALEKRLGSALEQRIKDTRTALEESSRALIEESTGHVREGLLNELSQKTDAALEQFKRSFIKETEKRMTELEERMQEKTRAIASACFHDEFEPAMESYFSRVMETGFFNRYFKNAVYDLTVKTVLEQNAQNCAWGFVDVEIHGTKVHCSDKVYHHLGGGPILIDVAAYEFERTEDRRNPNYIPRRLVNRNISLFYEFFPNYVQGIGDIQTSVLQEPRDGSFTLAVRTEKTILKGLTMSFIWFAKRCTKLEAESHPSGVEIDKPYA